MYPVRLGYQGALGRIEALSRNGHHAESLVTTVFTAEKTLRRTLRQLVVSAGFPSKQADKVVDQYRGLEAVKSAWPLYDPRNRNLTEIIANADWQTIKSAAEMRNKLVHGIRVYNLADCEQKTTDALAALNNVKTALDGEYQYSGWTTAKIRIKNRLHADPKVKWSQ